MSLSNTDLAYIAGFLDGEGCFTFTSSITVKAAITHLPTLEWLQSVFGGSLREHNSPTHKKQAWVWVVHAQAAAEVLEQVLPYLREKRRKAELLLEFQSTIGRRGVPVPDDIKSRRLEIREEVMKCR